MEKKILLKHRIQQKGGSTKSESRVAFTTNGMKMYILFLVQQEVFLKSWLNILMMRM